MRQRSSWTITLVAAAGLTTGAWADHGGGVHGGPGHTPDFDSGSRSHSSATSHKAGGANFETRLAANPQLSSRLQQLLPAGTTLEAAAMGFKNQGQFIAALHVSKNLNIPFDQLKADMTGPGHDSLGQAIHLLRPDMDSKIVKNNIKLADHEAKTDIEESSETAETASK
jgi:hypothetical protein